ncbi:hypothetical protein FHETE_8724 [Fusarium heterosporum]|uniref:Cytochrome b561 domain-containing protein n=1 Tax=Fusarium heterosporum TaxID=42747 RepID=A0A8H5WJX5_FUSHE|nr:hypothetical protein FHETE_8724 [Fusarium heterosporum]
MSLFTQSQITDMLNEISATNYVTQVLKNQVSKLHSRETCWHQSGVAGLVASLHANLSESQTWNSSWNVTTATQGVYNFNSTGNLFAVNLQTKEFSINGIDKDTFITLSYIHALCMIIAFFLVYPIILLMESTTVLCDLINRPVAKHKVRKWESALRAAVFTPLVIAGLVSGIIGMGSSDHYRTEHGIIGLITVVFAAFTAIIYFYTFFFDSWMRRTVLRMRWLQNLHYFDMFVCQVILMLSGFALTDGFDDLSIMGLCYIQISTAWAVSLGMIAAFVWNSAMVLMTAQWFLVRRARPGGVGVGCGVMLFLSFNI